jgi:hypothetical protein
VAAALVSAPAAAQTADDSVPAGPIVNSWYAGVNTGVAVVEKFGGTIGVEGGIRIWRNLDAVGEFFWTPNAVSSGQLGRVGTIVDALRVYGDAAGRLKVPTSYTGIGGRWVFENSGTYRPYVMATFGGARTNLKPVFTINGTDVTGAADDYGVTLGEDLIGSYTRFATEGGIGIVMAYRDTWYLDAGARLISINGNDERINVARLVLGGGYRF